MYSLKPWHSFKALWIIIFLFPTIMWGQASITGPGVVCEDETIQLTCQSCASPATPSGWSSSDQTVATINNSGVVTGLSAGTVTITYTDSGGNQITKTITVGATPYLLNNGVVVYYCQEANETRTIGFPPNPASNTISWFDKNNNSIITQGGVRTIDLSQPLDDTSYVCQVSPLGCQGPKSAVIAIVVATPLAPIVQDLDYCKDDIALPLTAQFGSSNPYSDVARSFYWFNSSNQVISPNAPSTNTVGTQTFYVQQVDSVPIAQYCYGPKSTLTVTTHANPGLPTVPITSFTYCQDETPSQISATADPGHHLNWYSSNGTPLSGPPTPSTTTPTYPGTPITYRVTQQNDLALNCESNYVTITVTVYPKAPTPTPTSALPIEYCEGDQTTQLSATMGVVGTLLWYSEDGTLLGSNPLPSTTVSDIGTTNYKVVLDPIDTTKCLSDTLTIPVIVHPRPNVTTTPAISICDGASIILNGGCVGCNEPVSYAWTGGVQNGVSFTPQYSNQPIVYTVTGTDDNQCENTAIATVTVLSLPNPPTINGGSTITLCQGSGDYTLSANSDGTSTLIWYGSNGTSVLSGPPTINTNTSGVGSFTYFVSQKNPNTTCESNKLQITVNVVLNPPAPATSNISVCKNSTAPGWGVTAINGTTLQWYASNGTTPLASAPTQNTNSVGSTTYYVSQKTTNCEGPKSSITFEVTALPPSPVPNPASYSYCFEQTAISLSATSLIGNSLRWYDTNGSLYNGTGTTAPTPPTTTSTTLYYEVSQVDANGCESPKASIPVIIQPEVPVPIANTANIYEYCVDDNTFQLNATMTSPNNVLVYYNSDGTKTIGNGSAPTPSSTTSGTIQYYVVQKSLVTGCESDPLNLTVQIHALPNITTTANVSACAGEGVTLSGSGAGTGGSYSWTGGVIDGQPFVPAFSNNPITYIVTGEDVNGCQNTDTATITVNALPGTPSVLSNSYSYCKDANASPLIANASSGHSLIWYDTDGTTVLSAPFTPPTNYTGTNIYYVSQVSATTNCESPTVPITVVVGVGIPKPTTFDRSACFGDPSTQLSATKITGNSLKWFAPDGTTQLAFAPTYSTLTIGTTSYYVSQVNPSTGCESPKDTLDVTIYALPPVSAGTDQTVCDGESVTLLGSGAVSYSWSGIDYAGNTISNGVAFTPPSSTSTSYTITGTDANGCSNTDAVTVNTNPIPVPPTIDPNSQTTFITGSVSSVLSAISLPGFTLTWYNSDGTLVNGTGSAPSPSTAPANVGITEYLVTQTSTSGCESAPLTVQIVVLGVNVSNDTTICLTDTAQLLVSTYSANNSTFNSTGYTFIGTYNGSDYYISPIDTSWSEVRNRALSDGGDLVNITDSAENYFVTQGLMPYSSTSFGPYYYMGIYQDLGSSLYAEPSGGWFTIDSNLVSYSNWKPGEPNNLLGTEHFAEIVIDSATQIEFWNDITDNQAKKYGVIEVPASTSPSWSYLWSTGDTTSTINVNPSVDTQYWVAISDGNNTWYDTVDVTVNLLNINITQTDTILCAGDSSGTLGVAINPGYGPYSYLWNTGDISDSLKNVSVGTYSVVVTDAMGCTADDAITIIQPNNMVVTTQSITNFNGYDVSCNGVNDAAAFVSAAGGTPGYSYSWSNGGATDTLTALAAGTYFVTVIDSNGCSSQDTLTITEPSALSLSVSTLTNVFGNQIDCYGDSSGVLFSAVAGGVGTYSYSWNTGASQDSIYNLGAGTYWVTAQDANGCTITDSITLTQPSLPFTTVASNLSNYNGFGISCNGAYDGSISVLAQGSNAPYSYAWSNGATTASQSNLGQGTYSVIVTDSLGCVSNASVVITEPSILTYSYIISDVTCYLGQNGSIEIIPQGGVMPYNIQWFDGTDSTVLDSLGSGYYAFTISDQNNCLVLDSVEIYEPAEIEITVDTIQPTCERINDGQIDAFIYGGTYPFSYTLNGSPVNLPLDSVAIGSYILTVVDSNSCTQTIAFDLEPLQPSCFMIPNMYSPNYDGYNDEFRIRHSSWSSYTLTIYNSIGQLVYSGSSSTPYWDGITNGSPMPTGDYYYQLITNEGEVIYGYVTLIR